MSTQALPPFEPKTTGSDKFDPDKRRTEIKQLYDASYKFINENYWEELVEAYRAVRVRTEPLMHQDEKGRTVEDTNRTNVCMPGLNTITKRKTARKTANPPTLNYYVPDDKDLLAERLTARAYYEYDRSGEAYEFKRFVNQADIFGFSYAKNYYDEVTIQRQMRYRVALLKDRRQFLQAQGAGDDQIQSELIAKGPDVGDQELSDFIQQNGPELRGTSPFTQYEGPVTKCRFIGDIFIEPGVLTLDASSYVIEKYTETDLWLRKMAAKTYRDPETQAESPVFDRQKVQELWDQESKTILDRTQDLRKELRAAIQKADPQIEQRILPGKRFDITEYHGPDKRGQMWIEYVGNDSIYLGRQPYPFDLGGKFVYTEYVPWPDLIGAFGDSSPRALRFLHAMHNANSGQIIDLVNQVLCRTYKVASVADIPEQAIKKDFGLFLVMKSGDLNNLQPFIEPNVPSDAWQTNAFIKTEMRENEPSLGGVDSGSEFNPQAEKTATTAILAAKSSDVLMQAEIDSLNLSLYELGTKKLEIHRQLSDRINVPNRPQYIKTEGLSQRYGKTSLITIDSVPELQDMGIEVEPVAGSTLAVDDELRANKIQNIYQFAMQNPGLWNQFKVAKLMLTTVKGVGATDDLLNDPAAQAPQGPKVGVNISIPLDKMPADIQQDVFQVALGHQSADLEASSKLEGVKQLSDAADAMTNLHSPATRSDVLAQQSKEVSKRVNGAPG